jgi:hypothetical protein
LKEDNQTGGTMPDADDFDVEYFRKLLRGGSGDESPKPDDRQPPPPAAQTARRAAKPPVAKVQAKPAAGPKRRKNR